MEGDAYKIHFDGEAISSMVVFKNVVIQSKDGQRMASPWNSMQSLGKEERILAVSLVLGIVLGFLLTPLGFESRMNELRTLAFAAFFIVVGLLIPIAGLILLFRRPRLASVLAIVDAILVFLTAPADQAMFFFTVPPPAAVTAGELILVLVGIVYMVYGTRIYDKKPIHLRRSG